jgi:hypothetical protein
MSVRQAEADPVTRTENSRAIRDTVEQHIKELISAGQLSEDGRLTLKRNGQPEAGTDRLSWPLFTARYTTVR